MQNFKQTRSFTLRRLCVIRCAQSSPPKTRVLKCKAKKEKKNQPHFEKIMKQQPCINFGRFTFPNSGTAKKLRQKNNNSLPSSTLWLSPFKCQRVGTRSPPAFTTLFSLWIKKTEHTIFTAISSNFSSPKEGEQPEVWPFNGTGPEATGTNWNTGGSSWTSDTTFYCEGD